MFESLSKNYYKVRWAVITNCDTFFYYKVRHGLLQGVTKCDDYYKLRKYSLCLHEDTVKQPLRTEKSQDNKIMS